MVARCWRPVWLVLGFAATVLGARELMLDAGLTLVEPHVNRLRSEQLYAFAQRSEVEDILFLGSSRVHLGIDAQLVEGLLARRGYELSAYELGLRGLRPPLCADVLAELVVRRPPRRLLVVGLETRYFALPAPEYAGAVVPVVRGEWESDLLVDPLTRGFRGVKALWHLPWTVGTRAQRAIAVHHELRGERVRPELRARGEAEALERRQVEERDDQLVLPPGLVWRFVEPDEPDRVAFARCLQLLDGLPCEVLFVRLPLLPGFVEQQMAGVTAAYEQQILPLVRERGFHYADLNRPPYPRDPEFFNGETHLNLRGSRLLSMALVDELLVPLFEERGVARRPSQEGDRTTAGAGR